MIVMIMYIEYILPTTRRISHTHAAWHFCDMLFAEAWKMKLTLDSKRKETKRNEKKRNEQKRKENKVGGTLDLIRELWEFYLEIEIELWFPFYIEFCPLTT